MESSDKEAAAAWNDRMKAVRHGCEAAVQAISLDGSLTRDLTEEAATDLLWTLLSVENWERLIRDCGWTQSAYEKTIKQTAEAALLSQS